MTEHEQPGRIGSWSADQAAPSGRGSGAEEIAALVRSRPVADPNDGGVFSRPAGAGSDGVDPDHTGQGAVPPPLGRTGNDFNLPTGSVGVLRGSRPLGGDGWAEPTLVAPEHDRGAAGDRAGRWSNVPSWQGNGESAGPGAWEDGGWETGATAAASGWGRDRATGPDHGWAAGPGVAETGGYDLVVDDDPYPGPFRQSFVDDAPRYRASPIWALINLLRPDGTKLLLGGTALVVAVVAAHAVGLVSLPFLGGDEQEVATSDQTTLSVPATPTTDGARAGAVLSQRSTTTGVAAGPVEVSVEPETEQTGTTTGEDPDPDPGPAPTRGPDRPTSTVEVPTSTTAAPVTSTTAASTTSTSSTSTSTSVPGPGPGQAGLVVQEANEVPGDAPAGTYEAVAVDADCEVVIARGAGGTDTITTDEGETITFDLLDGDSVTPGEGCPAVYDLS